MCFYIDKIYPKEKTAEKDIIAYKIVSKKYAPFSSNIIKNEFSPFYYPHITYKLGKKNPKVEKLTIIFVYANKTIQEGYHSYATKEKLDYARYSSLGEDIMVECVIPKGSKYYYSENHNEYVSDQIIIKKVIK